MKIYQKLAQSCNAWMNCILTDNKEWRERHQEEINSIVQSLPHGSGIDGTTLMNFDEMKKDTKIVLNSSYHAMDENGFYDGWYDFQLILKPSLEFGLSLSIKGNFGKYKSAKDYIGQVFYNALMAESDKKPVCKVKLNL